MNHYLIVFDRSTGAMIRKRDFGERGEALRARFAAEREFHDYLDIEVVVLGADSWEALERTHGRYFHSLNRLASAASDAARNASH